MATIFGKTTKAPGQQNTQSNHTHRPSRMNGLTVFRVNRPAARYVNLIGDANGRAWRKAMRRADDAWAVEVEVKSGWFFYAFEIDGETTWDRDAGYLRTPDCRSCSLAVIGFND